MRTLIIDNYDSFTYNLVHLVARHTDDYSVVRNDKISADEIRRLKPERIMISPGPGRPENAGITETVIEEFGRDIPVLGVCLGHQAIGHVHGARVISAPSLMHGKTSQITHDDSFLYNNVPQKFTATRYHSLVLDETTIGDDFLITARSEDDIVMGIRHKEWPLEGIQFHPESILTVEGPKLIENWMRRTSE
ncbi:anthranilate synthase component II [Natronogracilivirga saccharolytica]|uniref:Aminodeoxychorismate/anthranilate synthase component II n=1 Tax=Natronogracilivirga saccharolytica TaxID=2812953 RepID=A0A8J7S8X7_9BACT|nr:aminodeoxychorismate/anthranilate synthase component II [Natronogracilivirga saccharolytica]MBP3192416.1 aminodeoxychorismate/anthranilate synthase component II [Natronogracilivirga saccharolytica]